MPRISFLAPLILAAHAAQAEPALGPELAAASNFGQTWAPRMLDAAQQMGVSDLRDEIYWHGVEAGGRDRYDNFRTLYPSLLAARGMRLTVIMNNGHPEYDAGVTPYSPWGVAAFAGFAARLTQRFEAIDAIEVGNEMNSASFTSGPMREAEMPGKAAYYTALLRETYDAVAAVSPDVRIIGGAAHSIPLGWLGALSEAGAPAWMDSVALHPYTTRPEQFRRQVALMRALPGFEAMPIEVTEFGSEDAASAADYLVKYYCQMALSGVSRAVWYPLSPRGDGLEPLIDAEGAVTDVGRAFQMLQRDVAGQPVEEVAPDPFTYGCRFGTNALVLWGAERTVALSDPALRAVDARGAAIADPRLSPDRPLLVISEGAAPALGRSVQLGPQRMIADSFDQFAYPGQAGDPFERFARLGQEVIPFVLGPGQETNGVPWTPYLRTERDGLLRMNAEFLLPSMAGDQGAEIVHAYRAPSDMRIDLEAMVEPGSDSTDGVVLSLRLNGRRLDEVTATARTVLTRAGLALTAGDVLEIVVGPGASAQGDASLYRFTLRQALGDGAVAGDGR